MDQNDSPDQRYQREAREWRENVYQGDSVRQLSLRSITTGMLIGGIMSVSNLYVGLKTGWGLATTITSCIIAFALYRTLESMFDRFRRDPFTVLENYTMSSAASAAGYTSSAGLVSAIPALYLTTGRQMLWWEMMIWLGALSLLGLFMAIPLKRQLINIDKLPFPEGMATAETLRSMHTEGGAAIAKARSLVIAAVAGSLIAWWRDGFLVVAEFLRGTVGAYGPVQGMRSSLVSLQSLGDWFESKALPSHFPLLPTEGAEELLKKTSVGFEGSMLMVAAGAIMGIRVGASLLLGAIVYYGFIGSYLIDEGIIQGVGYKPITSWTLWPATAMMVTSGLLAFALRWRTVVRAFSGLTSVVRGATESDDPLDDIEVPGTWFVAGTLVAGTACVVIGHWLFDIAIWMGIVAVLLTFLLSVVAARATGETSITPIGAMGKITQLLYGVVAPTNITTNLMTANITAGAASHSADLLTDLKCGYLLGGNPRKQTISQFFGVIAGVLICVPVYTLIVDPKKIGGADMPAPAAKVWEGVARMLAEGPEGLPRGALMAMLVGGAIGIVITLAEEFAPPRFRKWIPSATALGVAGVIPAFNSISMFGGAMVAWIFSKTRPTAAEIYTVPIASGLIAGESLMGVLVIAASQGVAFYVGMLANMING